MEFTIRQATEKDFSIIQAFNAALFDYDAPHDDALDAAWPFSEAGIEYYKKSLVDPQKVVFIAQSGEKDLIGYVIGCAANKFRYRKVTTGELENMYVVPTWRRRGVGNALVGELKRWMKAKGVDRMYVSAYAKNEDAIHFYRACDFDTWEIGLEVKLS